MKNIFFVLTLLMSCSIFGQNKRTIKVTVPNKTDEVFITGNQKAFGDWKPDEVKMNKESEFVRSIEVVITYPAEFKFTKGDWNSEGILKQFNNNPNLKIENDNDRSDFVIKTWADDIDAQKLALNYDIQYIDSEYMNAKRMLKIALPMNYDSAKTYPVIYVTDAQSANFQVTKSYVNALSQGQFNIIPECIVVGIYQQQRNEDFYRNGSGTYFTEFIVEEVVPYIDKTYNTTGFNTIVGHSNGAEYNHIMMMEENNPFRGFISMSTWIRKNDNKKLTNFLKNYKGKKIYYYLANSDLDAPSRTQFGNQFEEICLESPNLNFKFIKNTVQGDHQTIVPNSLLEGLKFVFEDYGSLKAYPTIMDLDKNYLVNLKENYGIEGKLTIGIMDQYWTSIVDKRSKIEWEYLIDFVARNELWFDRGVDFVNIANGYYAMEMYPETIDSYKKAVDDIENCEDLPYYKNIFYKNLHRPIDSYVKEGRNKEVLPFLEKVRKALPDEYYLGITFKIAKFSFKNKIDLKKGNEALTYLKTNFKENNFFSKETLEKLETI